MTENKTNYLSATPNEIPHFAFSMFSEILKNIKKDLPKSCTFLSPLKTTNGDIQVRAIVNKNEYRFTTPKKLNFTDADIERLKNSLLEKC